MSAAGRQKFRFFRRADSARADSSCGPRPDIVELGDATKVSNHVQMPQLDNTFILA